MTDRAPFIPPSADASADLVPPSPGKLFRNRPFVRLWMAQVVASLGDWVGIIAILAIAARISDSGAGIGLVMVARLLPGFLFAPVGGALVDRWDRKKVLVVCNLGRAVLLAVLPFFTTLWGLILISFGLEVMALLWSPAKEASVPKLVRKNELAAANSLSLVAAYGMFPLGSIVFAAMAGLAAWLGGFAALDFLGVNQESLAIWLNSGAFLVSAVLLAGIPLDGGARPRNGDDTGEITAEITGPTATTGTGRKVDLTQTFREIGDGLRYIGTHGLVRAVMVGIAGGLVGGGAVVPLGPVFAFDVLGGGPATFGLLMTALGIGTGLGVGALLLLQKRLPRPVVFVAAIIGTGVGIIAAGTLSTIAPVVLLVAFVGACAGSGYVTGFTLLQETVVDELRGRTFATLYTVVRLCLLLALTLAPFGETLLDRLSRRFLDGELTIGVTAYALPGVRLSLWLGGLITLASGFAAWHLMRRAGIEAVQRSRDVVGAGAVGGAVGGADEGTDTGGADDGGSAADTRTDVAPRGADPDDGEHPDP